ncbi:protocadherin gamma-A4-like [Tachyglossus aculeatus]|uniref:protocadherin gamma-A4-like n=1 Tax=Tachyglossus aculeatus TaxID=9261 RepID=UPI0018F3EB8B|nr:protocadherin gamma-A4-like [Tachyglossus aculeatus]
MAAPQMRRDCRGRALLCLLLGILWKIGSGQIRYSVPEEMEKGSFVGDVAKDLGLEPRELTERRVRIVSREILVEDKVKIYGIEVEITDINDNAPRFMGEEMEIKISESSAVRSRFPLPEAHDPDVGANSLQGYQLSPNRHFSLDVQDGTDGSKNAELVLERVLDREEEAVHHLVLTALDGGDPVRSGTARIRVTVVDANDNAPVFTQSVYQVSIPEDAPVGTQVVTVNATDPDEGVNAEVTYSFRKITDKTSRIFQLNTVTGEICTLKNLDYQESEYYEMEVQAQDGPGLLARAKVLVTIVDVNDNAPEVTITSLTSSVPEDSPPGTVIALLNVHDRDSGDDGLVTCSIPDNLPFKLKKSYGNYYSLVTDNALDRELISHYNVTVTATDRGSPPLSAHTYITLHVTDTNDNPPAFEQTAYSVYIPENNPRGASVFRVTARDPDSEENARVTYSISEEPGQGPPLSSYVSINSETGVLYALRSFDYEQFRELQLLVTARDGGTPALSSNVSVTLLVLDENDNAPEILYPSLPTDGSTGVELAPRSAEPGYLVTKVVAVDGDSGQNAWLSYRLLKATEPGLFSVGLHTGEIRTARSFLDKDALKQSLVVAVRDNGEPPLSATVTVTVAVADSIPEILSDLGSLSTPADPESSLTLYLVVAVAAVSCLFLAFIIVLLALRLRRWRAARLLESSSGYLGGVPASHFVGIDGVRAFLQTYSHEVSLTTDSRKSQLLFPQPNYSDTLTSQRTYEKKEPLLVPEDLNLVKDDQSVLQIRYSIPEEMAKGSVVGHLAGDLGLNIRDVSARKLRVSAEKQLFTVSAVSGDLLVSDRIDREQICGERVLCELQLESVVENPLNVFYIHIAIQDINDNSPLFKKEFVDLKMNELALPGARFGLESAVDPDVGMNSVDTYQLSPNQHFSLAVKESPDGSKFPEIVLAKSLDREDQSSYHLLLTAVDGGDPVRSGTAQIRINVTDANDNPPVFRQDVYKVSLRESLPPGSPVLRVEATDQDEGLNAQITFSFSNIEDTARHMFSLDPRQIGTRWMWKRPMEVV